MLKSRRFDDRWISRFFPQLSAALCWHPSSNSTHYSVK
jgi:hypothetical protein